MVVVSPVKLSHVVLYSRQVPIMRDWYVNVLGGRVVHEAPGIVFLTYDDEHHRVAVADPAALAEVGGGLLVGEAGAELSAELLAALPPHGLAHVAFTYGALLELLETWERLQGDAILPVHALNHGPTTSLYSSSTIRTDGRGQISRPALQPESRQLPLRPRRTRRRLPADEA
jgi:catechol 2,3-dioxygenase-like lactoylglutathione lyase family enzyme